MRVQGRVQKRPDGTQNEALDTGLIEVYVSEIEVLSPSRPLPFLIEDDVDATEEVRLKYRFLDLRRPSMQRKLIQRHRIVKSVRDCLDAEGFVEIETPVLTKSTPEGARDHLVPSRVHPGRFYALPQSPQLFKQLLMVSGFERYYQIVKCYRDEDLRPNRQPESSPRPRRQSEAKSQRYRPSSDRPSVLEWERPRLS